MFGDARLELTRRWTGRRHRPAVEQAHDTRVRADLGKNIVEDEWSVSTQTIGLGEHQFVWLNPVGEKQLFSRQGFGQKEFFLRFGEIEVPRRKLRQGDGRPRSVRHLIRRQHGR